MSSDHLLDEELRRLPRLEASAGFTDRVLAELERPGGAPSRLASPRLVWATLAAGALLLGMLTVLHEPLPETAPEPLLESALSGSVRTEELRRQHALLTEELERLRSRTEAAAPVLYLGSDDEVDYVLDLSPFLLPQAAGILPASNNGSPSTTF